MKKLITSAGVAVLGAASLNAQQLYAPAPTLTSTQLSKPWSVSAAVRGFYDDNYALTPSHGFVDPTTGAKVEPQSSWGWEVAPSAALNWKMEQTYIGLSYTYDIKYFEDRPEHKYDQAHLADFKLSHAFTDRYKLDLADSFVITKEPDLIAPSSAASSTLRTREDMLRNYGSATFNAGLTDQLGVLVGYSNTLYDFSDEGIGSLSSLLDRMEHLATVNLRWQVLPSTVALIGYQFGVFDYTGNEQTLIPYNHLNITRPGAPYLWSDERNSYSHYGYVGVDHSFNPQLDTSIRVGVQYTDYYNLPGSSKSDTTPYADANITYRMTPDSAVQLGVRHSKIATDASALDQDNTTVYGSFSYKILPQFTAAVLGQYQYNTFAEGQQIAYGSTLTYKDQVENFWLAGINLTYEINRFLGLEAGYNYDHLDSDISIRSFARNRVYFGLRASY